MYAYNVGNGPRLTAPGVASSIRATGAESVVVDAVSPANLNPQKEFALVARATQSREQIEHQNFVSEASADKAFQTLRSLLGLRGYGLSCTHNDDGPVCFHVNRWGMVRELSEIASARAFAQQVGAAHA